MPCTSILNNGSVRFEFEVKYIFDEYEPQSPPDFLISMEFTACTDLMTSNEKRDTLYQDFA
jgi:hypothetical protein